MDTLNVVFDLLFSIMFLIAVASTIPVTYIFVSGLLTLNTKYTIKFIPKETFINKILLGILFLYINNWIAYLFCTFIYNFLDNLFLSFIN